MNVERLGDQLATVTLDCDTLSIALLLMESGFTTALKNAKDAKAPILDVIHMTISYSRIVDQMNTAKKLAAIKFSNSKLEEIRCKSN